MKTSKITIFTAFAMLWLTCLFIFAVVETEKLFEMQFELEEYEFNPSRDLLAASKADRESAQRYLKNQRKVSRYNFFTTNQKLKKTTSNFCGRPNNSPSAEDCEWDNYAEGILLGAALTFIIAFLTCICCPCFLICKCCCCGGYFASKGIFFPGTRFTSLDNAGYTTKDVWAVKLAAWIICGLAVIFCIVGFVGNAGITKGVHDFRDITIGTAKDVIDEIRAIDTSLQDLPLVLINTTDYSNDFNKSLNEADRILNEYDEIYSDYVKRFNRQREIIYYFPFVFCLILFGLPAIAAFFNFSKLTILTFVFGFPVMSLMWICFSLHYPITLLIADFCLEIDKFLEDNSDSSFVQILLDCENNTAYKDFSQSIQDLLNQTVDVYCENVFTICTLEVPCPQSIDGNETCPVATCPFNVNECSNDTATEFFQSIIISDILLGCPNELIPPFTFDPGQCPNNTDSCDNLSGSPPPILCGNISRTVAECSQSCSIPIVRDTAQILIDANTLFFGILNIIQNQVLPLLNCKRVTDLIFDLKDVLCVTLINALFNVTLASGFLGALFPFGIIVAFMGLKRFNTDNHKPDDLPRNADSYRDEEKGYELEPSEEKGYELQPSYDGNNSSLPPMNDQPLYPAVDDPYEDVDENRDY